MTLRDMINKTIYYQDVQVFTSGDSTLVFEGTVEEAIEAIADDDLAQEVECYEYDDDVLNIYVEVSASEASEPEETVTIVENRHLRKTIHSVTTSCFLTKKEYMQIMGVIYNACDRTLKEVLKEAIKETDEDAKVN